MGLMTGSGPFGREPAGEFNFSTPGAGRVLFVEPTRKRIRVAVSGETVADSRGVVMVHESGHQPIYYFPPEDVRADVLEPTDHHTTCPKKGEASYYTICAGDAIVENGAWYYPEPFDHAPPALRAASPSTGSGWITGTRRTRRPSATRATRTTGRWPCSRRTCRCAGTCRPRTSSPG
jgi:uncharacterized protein (DUF427 family)